MTRLSIKALRLYADNGLLQPAIVDASSGYRYYDMNQLGRAEIIRVLRSVDMPLEQIRVIVDAKDGDAAVEQLLAHRRHLSERLANQERMLAYLESIIQNEGRIVPFDIEITDANPQQIAAVKINTNLSQIANDISAGFGTLMQGMAKARVHPAGAPMIVYHSVIDEETSGDIELCVPIAGQISGGEEVYARELEGGTMAMTLHKGPYERISPAYHALMSWIPDNGYEIAGPPRETYLNDPRQVAPDELMTRVEFPVCAASEAESATAR